MLVAVMLTHIRPEISCRTTYPSFRPQLILIWRYPARSMGISGTRPVRGLAITISLIPGLTDPLKLSGSPMIRSIRPGISIHHAWTNLASDTAHAPQISLLALASQHFTATDVISSAICKTSPETTPQDTSP